MRIGQLNVPFDLKTPRIVDDGNGGSVTDWTVVASFWGDLQDYQPSRARSDLDGVTHVLVTHVRSDVDFKGACRLQYGSRMFLIIEAHMPMRQAGVVRLLLRESQFLN